MVPALIAMLSSLFKTRAALQLENLALRHQIGILKRSARERPKLPTVDRILWVWLSRVWADWRSVLIIVKPETVVAWHRKGFRRFWTWKVRHGQAGRPAVHREVRKLIRERSRENPLWGAPRIHGELLKLGIDIGETSVGKYMVRPRRPPSQTWRTFLDNHVKSLVLSISSPCRRFDSRSCTSSWFWRTTAGGFFISMLRPTPPRNGLRSSSAKPSPGIGRRAIFYVIVIVIGSSVTISPSRSAILASRKCYRHRGHPGNARTWNA